VQWYWWLQSTGRVSPEVVRNGGFDGYSVVLLFWLCWLQQSVWICPSMLLIHHMYTLPVHHPWGEFLEKRLGTNALVANFLAPMEWQNFMQTVYNSRSDCSYNSNSLHALQVFGRWSIHVWINFWMAHLKKIWKGVGLSLNNFIKTMAPSTGTDISIDSQCLSGKKISQNEGVRLTKLKGLLQLCVELWINLRSQTSKFTMYLHQCWIWVLLWIRSLTSIKNLIAYLDMLLQNVWSVPEQWLSCNFYVADFFWKSLMSRPVIIQVKHIYVVIHSAMFLSTWTHEEWCVLQGKTSWERFKELEKHVCGWNNASQAGVKMLSHYLLSMHLEFEKQASWDNVHRKSLDKLSWFFLGG